MILFGAMCNQPQRLAEAIAPVRANLVAPPPVSRWGLGYIQSGDVLLVRTPRPSTTPVDLYAALQPIHSDCIIGHAVSDTRFAGTDNTPPFRFRRWMFAQTGQARAEEAWPTLLERIPEYLRRNIKGKTASEMTFHLLLAMLHDLGALDDANLPLPTIRRALGAAVALVADELTRSKSGERPGNVIVSNGRSLLAARVNEPMYLRRLQVSGERRERDETFRGVLILSTGGANPGEGFEELAVGTCATVSRDLRIDLAPLAA